MTMYTVWIITSWRSRLSQELAEDQNHLREKTISNMSIPTHCLATPTPSYEEQYELWFRISGWILPSLLVTNYNWSWSLRMRLAHTRTVSCTHWTSSLSMCHCLSHWETILTSFLLVEERRIRLATPGTYEPLTAALISSLAALF